MTPERFWLAMVMFHVMVSAAAWFVLNAWRDEERCRRGSARWLALLGRDAVLLGLVTYLASLGAGALANLDYGARVHLGPLSLRLLGQAIFAEAVLLGLGLSWQHRRACRLMRAAVLGAGSCLVLAASVDAYYVEPRMLVVRRHTVDEAGQGARSRTLRILHITDLQTPSIGAHEEHALRTGLSYRPDLIVFTGDYVQDALGRPTEEQAARDLRALMERIGFAAPLGIFATEGDVGPPCRAVFSGTQVRCLADQSARLDLPGGGTLGITGLSRGNGRVRRPEFLGRLLSSAPGADHRIIISHAPDFVDALPVTVSLVLAGHTHGGQVVVPLFGPPKTAIRLPRRYAGGLHEYRGTPLHVSRGVGMERGFEIPVRFFCPPEIGVIDLRLPPPASPSSGL